MSKILLASDFDGTISTKRIVPKITWKKIKSFRRKGNIFAYDSGRTPFFFDQEAYDNVDYIIGCSGAIITDNKLNLLYAKTIPDEDAEVIFEVFKKLSVEAMIVESAKGFDIVGKSKRAKLLRKVFFSINTIKNKKLKEYKDFTQISAVFLSEKQIDVICKSLKHLKNIKCHKNNHSVDITSSEVDKGKGIRELNKIVKADKIYCIGDEINDLPMLKKYESFTVSSGNPKIRKYTKYVVKNIRECIDVIESLNKEE